MRENLLRKNLVEEVITSFFGASNVPSQSLCLGKEILLNTSGMCDDRDGIKNRQRNLFLGRLKTLEVKSS